MPYNPIPYGQDPGQFINQRINGLVAISGAPGQNGADTTEDTLQSFTLQAGLLIPPPLPNLVNPAFAPRCLKIRAWGVTANNTDVKTLRVYHGTTVFSQALTTSTTNAWLAELELMATSAVVQIARFIVWHGAAVLGTQQLTNGADNLTTALVAKVTGQASVGNAGDIVCNGCVVELVA